LALEAYDTLDKMPNLPERFRVSVELYRGLTYLLTGRLEKAIEVYSAGVRFPGLDLATRASVLVNRALAHWQLKHNDEAIADLNTVIDTLGTPDDQRIKAILGKAEIYLGLGRYDDAESETNKVNAFELTPNEAASATLLLGQAWAAQGRIEDAIANCQKILTHEKIDDRYRQIASTLLPQFTPK